MLAAYFSASSENVPVVAKTPLLARFLWTPQPQTLGPHRGIDSAGHLVEGLGSLSTGPYVQPALDAIRQMKIVYSWLFVAELSRFR